MNDLRELADRLRSAQGNLEDMAEQAKDFAAFTSARRLESKASGVALALSYVEEMLRERAR